MAEIKGISIEFKGETVDLENSIANLNRTMKALKSESANLNKQLKLDPSNVEKLSAVLKNLENQQKVLSKELEIYKENLKGLEQGSQEWLDMSKKIDGVEKALSTVQQRLKTFNSWKADQINKQFEKVGKTIQNVGNKVENFGNKFTVLSTASGASLTLAAKTAIDFEDAFAGVAKTVDATDEELAVLRDGIIELSKVLPASTTEISAIAESAGQLGIAKDDILEFSKVMIGLGEATNLTSEDASTMIAQFANVVDISGEYERFGSALVELGNNGASTEAEIMELAQRLSGAGSVAGLSAQEILGLSASMANVGINAEAGGTAMSTLISQMERASIEGGSSLQEFAKVSGMSAEEFAQAWSTEPSVAIDAFLSGLNAIQTEGGNVYGTLETLGINEKRLTDTVLRLSSATGQVAINTEMANRAWEENVALTTETEKRYATTKSELKKLQNNIEAIGIQLGETLLPIINDIVSAVSPIVQKFSEMSPALQKVTVAVLAIGTALAPFLIILGKVITSVGTIVSFIGTSGAGAGLASALGGLAGPIGLAVAAFATFWASSEKFRTSIGNLVASIGQGLTPTLQTVYNVIMMFYETFQVYLMPLLQKIGDFLGLYIVPILQKLWEWFSIYILPILNALVTLMGGAFNATLQAIFRLFEGLVDILSEVASWFADIWGWLEDTYVWEIFGEVIGGISEAVEILVGWIQSLVEWLVSAIEKIGEFLSGVAEIAGSAWDGITSIIGGVFGSGGYGSGGYASGAIALTTNITVNTNREITQEDTKSWALQMVDVINEELGKRL